MTVKIIGAVLIIAGCGSCGFSLAAAHKREERALHSLLRAIEMMICELEQRMPPLPELVKMAGAEARGAVGEVFHALSERLETQEDTDASAAMGAILPQFSNIPDRTRQNMRQLGQTLGRFALSGQVSGFRAAAELCKRDLTSLAKDREPRLRSYRTLGICAGVALVILFL